MRPNSMLCLFSTRFILLSILFARLAFSWTHSPLPKSPIISTRRVFLSPSPNYYYQWPTATALSSLADEGDMEEEDAWYENLDVLLEEGNELYGDDTEEDWIPDAEKAKGRRRRDSRDLIPAKEVLGDSTSDSNKSIDDEKFKKKRPSPYTEEEEELIAAMGGKEKKEKASPREIGYLGDSSLRDIARDYSVPICYLADVLVMWGVPVPINVNDRLGDLVTGEQAFALVEAVNSLDMGHLNDRYSNQNMLQVCDGWEIDIKDAFEFAMKEGWSLPFGVRTNLRVEQEDELLRVFSTLYREVDED